jgi:hypothetical protein
MAPHMSSKRVYQKPSFRLLGAIAGAEGFCAAGSPAYGHTCSSGPADTSTCWNGGQATIIRSEQLCTNGGDPANCLTNGIGAGG